MDSIVKHLEKRYPGDGLRKDYREHLYRICKSFLDSEIADSNFIVKLTSESDAQFWSCLSEALIYDRIRHKQFLPRPAVGVGPDFLLADGVRRVWIEVICPEPKGLSNNWLKAQGTTNWLPHRDILLRWTSAIKEKNDKLVGGTDGKEKGYLLKGHVSEKDAYVIVVNGCQLRHGPFPALHGITKFPFAAEAVFPIGPTQIHLDRHSLKSIGSAYQVRFHIPKPNGMPISTYAFLDPRYKMVSAIWAVDFNGCSVIGNREPSALIHNPNAANQLQYGFLPADEEFIATRSGEEYTFKCI
jgi:hypothetical protein